MSKVLIFLAYVQVALALINAALSGFLEGGTDVGTYLSLAFWTAMFIAVSRERVS